MSALEDSLKKRYASEDSTIFKHGNNYFRAASILYDELEVGSIYPILTLLGLAVELFFKSFDVNKDEKYVELGQGVKALTSKNVKTANKNGHSLKKLFEHYRIKDKDLYDYLVQKYQIETNRDLSTDLNKYSNLFVDCRYIFENPNQNYTQDLDIIYKLVEFLYNTISNLFSHEC